MNSADTDRGDRIGTDHKNEDVLTRGVLHKILVYSDWPSKWPAARVCITAITIIVISSLPWLAQARDVRRFAGAVLILALVSAGDAFLLSSLPRRGLSFGSWKSGLLVLLVPRAAVSALLAAATSTFDLPYGTAVLAVAQGVGSAVLVWSLLVEPFRLRLTRMEMVHAHLPGDVSPIRLLHISDLHIERLTKREEKLLTLIKEADPEIILVTGDYLNLSYTRDAEAHAHAQALLGKFSAPYGVFAVLGSPPVDERDVVPALFDGLDIKLLVDAWREVDLGQGRKLVLLGIDCTHHLPTDRRKLAGLVAAAPNHAPNVLMYHAPDLMPEAIAHSIDLYLSGHTHGGQVRLPLFGALITSSQLGKRFEMGPYREQNTLLYVSRGVGMEGLGAPRLRFLAPPEITLFTIRGNGSKGA